MINRFWPGVVLGAILSLSAMVGGRLLAPTPSDAKSPPAGKGDRGGLGGSRARRAPRQRRARRQY